jgi:hypothetical protein
MVAAPALAGALVLALAAFSLAGGCAGPETAATVLQKSALAALPRESVAVLVLDIRSLKALEAVSRWMEEMAAAAEQEGAFREVKDRFGTEALKRLTRVGLALVPRPDRTLGYALLAEGDFDAARLKEALGGQEILTFIEMEGKPDFSATVLEGGGLALGPRLVLQTVRANAGRAGQGITGNATLLAALGRLPHDAQIWGAVDCRSLGALVPQPQGEGPGAGPAAVATAPLQALKAIAFQSTIGKTVTFSILGESDDEASAKTQADAVRGIVALGRMSAGQDQALDWLAFLDALDIEQQGAEIRVQGSIPESTLAALARQAREGVEGSILHEGEAAAPPGADGAPPVPTR